MRVPARTVRKQGFDSLLPEHQRATTCWRSKLLTGRHHQIRAQLSAMGSHIKGDVKYGSARTNRDGSIHLHAHRIEFIHPVKNEPVVITALPPKDPVWDYFVSQR